MFRHYCSVPFHNLNLLYGKPSLQPIPGGTCSDKTLLFVSAAKAAGIDARLHTAFIGGKEIHRLALVKVDGRSYYADVGNGWPNLRLMPADEVIVFSCYGMGYRTEISGEWIRVYHSRNGTESQQMEIHTTPRPENQIFEQIKSRFELNIEYPFAKSLRFSFVVGDEFVFLRGNRIERYSNTNSSVREVASEDIPGLIQTAFGFDVRGYFR